MSLSKHGHFLRRAWRRDWHNANFRRKAKRYHPPAKLTLEDWIRLERTKKLGIKG